MRYTRLIANACLLALTVGLGSLSLAQSAPTPAVTPSSPSGGATASTAAPKPAPVQVTSHGDQLQVKVPDQAPLSTVMSSVCQEQKLKCTGTETLTTYHGPAMSVEGTLRQVISKLVEGTDINYEFSRSAEGGATAIAFLGHAPKGSAPVPTVPEPAPTRPRPLHSRPFPGNPPSQAGPPPAGPQSQLIEPEAMPDPEAQPTTVDPEQAKRSERAAAMLSTGSGNPSNNVLPFPDAQGTPIPISNTPATMLPFPDQFGNPIRVKPGAVGSPFPMKGTGSNTGNAGTETKQ